MLGPGAVLFLSLFAGQAAVLVLAPILPDVAGEFGVSTATAGQLRSLSGVAGGLAAVGLGVLARRLRVRQLLAGGLALLAFGSLASASAPSFTALAAAQVAIGAGVAAVLSAGVAAAGEWARPQERTRVLSWALLGQPAAWVAGMPLVGIVAEFDWRLAWLVLPLASSALARDDGPDPGRGRVRLLPRHAARPPLRGEPRSSTAGRSWARGRRRHRPVRHGAAGGLGQRRDLQLPGVRRRGPDHRRHRIRAPSRYAAPGGRDEHPRGRDPVRLPARRCDRRRRAGRRGVRRHGHRALRPVRAGDRPAPGRGQGRPQKRPRRGAAGGLVKKPTSPGASPADPRRSEVTQVIDKVRNGVDTEKMFATLDLIK